MTEKTNSKKTPKHPKSKKHLIKKLPAFWMCEMFKIQQSATSAQPPENRGNSLFALAISMSTGLRPEELAKGITLKRSNAGFVEITIQGAKRITDEFGESVRGIETRTLTINPHYCEASKYLHEQVPLLFKQQENTELRFRYNKSTLFKVVSSLGQRFLEKHHSRITTLKISPYAFRHQFAAMLKSCTSMNNTERAQCLGHLSTESMQRYAKAFRSKSSVKPIITVNTSEIPHLKEPNFGKIKSAKIAPKKNMFGRKL